MDLLGAVTCVSPPAVQEAKPEATEAAAISAATARQQQQQQPQQRRLTLVSK
jgi:hypothetical protein